MNITSLNGNTEKIFTYCGGNVFNFKFKFGIIINDLFEDIHFYQCNLGDNEFKWSFKQFECFPSNKKPLFFQTMRFKFSRVSFS